MQFDLVFDPFGARWPDLRDAALAAEDVGFDGVWTWDHLAGSVHGQDRVLECWTVLAALAERTDRLMLGPLVLNVANRRPGVLATMAATLQEVAAGRLLLGLGAGGGRGVPYPAEQEALGVAVPPDPVRRAQVVEAVAVIRQVWTGSVTPTDGTHYRLGSGSGFIVPDPRPPIIIGAFGPKMAAVAGAVGDGINTHGNSPRLAEMLATARRARSDVGLDPDQFVVTVGWPFASRSLRAERIDALADLGVDRLTMLVRPPFDHGDIVAVGRALPR